MRRYERKKEYPSLYDAFELGDRVKRVLYNEKGETEEYRGIILAISEESVEIYWDTLNGHYQPEDMKIGFTNCAVDEVFKGNENYSPIKKEKES